MNRVLSGRSILLFLLLSTLAFTVYSKFIVSTPSYTKPVSVDEKFNEDFLQINTLEKLDSLIIGHFRNNNNDTARTVLYIDNFLRNRFYHSYSRLSWEDNWISVLCGKFFWEHFLFPVVPENIIEYPMAACSQQGIIFQQQLANLKIPCSTIQFYPVNKKKPGHYAVSVYYGNSWHFFDSNREPYIVDSTMPSIEKIIDKKLYTQMYSRPSNLEFQEFFKNKSYKRVNKEPFSKGNMHYFQVITAFFSNWLWLIFLIAYGIVLFLSSRKSEAYYK